VANQAAQNGTSIQKPARSEHTCAQHYGVCPYESQQSKTRRIKVSVFKLLDKITSEYA